MVQTRERLRYEENPYPRRHQLDRVGRRGRALLGGRAGQLRLLPVEDVVEGMQHDLAGQVARGHFLSSSAAATAWSLGITTTVVSV